MQAYYAYYACNACNACNAAGCEAVKRSRDAVHSQVYSRDKVLYFESRDGLKEVIGFVGEARTIDDLKERRLSDFL
jgi:hypothetical protein